VIDGVKSADPSKIRTWAVDQLLAHAVQALEPKPVAGAEAVPVVEGYLTAREELFASADVDSPDFRYERFAHSSHQFPGDFAPEVERERQKYVAEKTKPDGVITHRLTGKG
jgi:hypothetical protein